MRIAVMGAGGVGGYFGTKLAATGYDVTFIARGDHLEAMRANGLRIESPLGDTHLEKPNVTEDPAAIGPVDVVMFGVKLWDTKTVAQAIKPLVGSETAVVSFQNGVQKDDILREILGEKAVMGGVAYIATSIAAPGVIRHVGQMQKLVFGEYDGTVSKRVEAFLQACRAAGIDSDISHDIRRAIWEKFVFLVGLSGTTTSMRQSIGPIRSHPQTRVFLHDAMREVVDVGRAQGVGLAEDFADNRLAFCDGLPAEMTSSMHHDLQKGNRLEVEWLSGDVVRRGKQAGIPTPVNRSIFDVLALYADGAK